jgi:four helix bundle protein
MEARNAKPYNLEERTFQYAKDVFGFVRFCPKSVVNDEVGRQLIRSSGSVGANYVEARESLGKKDLAMRIRICRKEVKESGYWPGLFEARGEAAEKKRHALIEEATELLKIFTSIVEKLK